MMWGEFIMPIPICRNTPEIYCSICGTKIESKLEIGSQMLELSYIWHPILKIFPDCVSIECEQCKTKLIYNRKKDTVKIIK